MSKPIKVLILLFVVIGYINSAHSELAFEKTNSYSENNSMISNDELTEQEVINLKLDDIQKRVEFITSLSKEELENNLDELTACLNAIQELSLYLPKNSTVRSASVYFASENLRGLAFNVVHYLSDKDLIDYELSATDIYANIILNFFNTNYALVGDGMIKSAIIHEKTNDNEISKRIYSAILKDFIVVIERLESSEEKIDQNDELFFALSSLETACTRLVALNHLDGENSNATSVLNRIEALRKK